MQQEMEKRVQEEKDEVCYKIHVIFVILDIYKLLRKCGLTETVILSLNLWHK